MNQRINSIDVTKFILSFFVIALHTLYPFQSVLPNHGIIYTILHMAVPFFFITSGYLLFRKIEIPINKVGINIIMKYIKRIFSLYCIWTIIYLPISLYGAYINHIKFSSFILAFIRKFLFVGEFYYSWNLWYLNGLIVAVLIILLLLIIKIKPKYILVFGITVFFSGLLLDYFLNIESGNLPIFINKILNVYSWIFEKVRNGIFRGFPYLSIGFYLSHQKLNLKKGIVMFLTGFILYYFKVQCGLIPLATGMFIIVCNVKMNSNRYLDYFRISSILIYLLHMIFVFIYVELINYNNNFNSFILFVFVSISCLISSTFIYFLSKKYKIVGKLYGYKK